MPFFVSMGCTNIGDPTRHVKMKAKWLFSVALSFCFATAGFATDIEPRVINGIIDLRQWNFEKNGEVKLDGSWFFFWNQFLTQKQIAQSKRSDYFNLPSVWNGNSSVYNKLDGKGFATYSVTLLVDPSVPLLALGISDFYSSYRLFINDKEVASNGTVGINRKQSEAQWRPMTVAFAVQTDTLHLVLHVSNFQHHKGGAYDHIYLGLPEQLFQKREQAVITNIVLFGGLGLIGFFFLILFFFFRNEKAALYFAAICITWAIRSVFNNLYLFINWFPGMDWELAVKMEYLTLYLTMMWGILFIAQLFPEDTNAKMKRAVLVLNFLFIALTLATPAFTYTTLLPAYMVVMWIIICYIAFVVGMAILYKRKGAWFSVAGILLGLVMFSYDMLTHSDILDFSPLLFNIGYVFIFLLNATAFAYQLSKNVTSAKPVEEFQWSIK